MTLERSVWPVENPAFTAQQPCFLACCALSIRDDSLDVCLHGLLWLHENMQPGVTNSAWTDEIPATPYSALSRNTRWHWLAGAFRCRSVSPRQGSIA